MSKSSPSHALARSSLVRSPMRMPQRPSRAQGKLSHVGYKGRSLGSFVPKLTQGVFQKYGFSAATLLTDWATIVGPDIAAYTAPERLKWARGVDQQSASEEGDCGRPGATLMLRVEPVRALDVSYRSRQLIDRINAYFGYSAVAGLRLVQAPVVRTATSVDAAPPLDDAPPTAAIAAIDDKPLRLALANLEASIRAEKRRQNTGHKQS